MKSMHHTLPQKSKIQILIKATLFIVFIFFTPYIIAQSTIECGSYTRPNPPSLEKNNERIYIDRFNNYYLESELIIDKFKSPGMTCVNNTFSLTFGTGFTSSQESTICQVFIDIALLMGDPIPTYLIEILVLREQLDPTTGGTGSPNWNATCGIANSSIQQKINGGGQDLPSGFVDGIIRLNSLFSNNFFFTLDGGTIGSTQVDLYSLILHEALHIMGFASRIGASGEPMNLVDNNGNIIVQNDAYSLWDTYLFSEVNDEFLVEPDTNSTDCCNAQMFNSSSFPNFPVEASGGCANQIVFNGSETPNVNNNTTLNANSNNGQIANSLSHLPNACDLGQTFVMNPGIPSGIGGVNRTISDIELGILCDLGYPLIGQCATPCVLDIQNDFYADYVIGVTSLTIAEMYDNDTFPANSTITFDFECSNFPPGSISGSPSGTKIFLQDDIPPGLYSFCYTVTGCNGQCDQAEVFVFLGLDECNNDCNLFCQGDFEPFLPKSSSYFNQLDLDDFKFLGTQGNANTPDVYYGPADNRFVHFGTPYNIFADFESILIPLSAPIEPNCTANISFSAVSDLPGSTLLFYASENAPCLEPIIPTCEATGFASCPDYNVFCMNNVSTGILVSDVSNILSGSSSLVFGGANNVVPYPYNIDIGDIYYRPNAIFTPYSFSWTNTTSDPINFIHIIGNSISPPTSGLVHYFVDDIEIYSSCDNEVTITPIVPEPVCIGEHLQIIYEICHTGPSSTSTDVTLTLGDLPTGVFLGTGGDFNNGTFTISNVAPNGPCQFVTLDLFISDFLQPGTIVTIEMDDVNLSNSCWGDTEITTAEFVVVECDATPIPCDCEETLITDLVIETSCVSDPGCHKYGDYNQNIYEVTVTFNINVPDCWLNDPINIRIWQLEEAGGVVCGPDPNFEDPVTIQPGETFVEYTYSWYAYDNPAVCPRIWIENANTFENCWIEDWTGDQCLKVDDCCQPVIIEECDVVLTIFCDGSYSLHLNDDNAMNIITLTDPWSTETICNLWSGPKCEGPYFGNLPLGKFWYFSFIIKGEVCYINSRDYSEALNQYDSENGHRTQYGENRNAYNIDVNIYPNPASNVVSIVNNNHVIYEVEMISSRGDIVRVAKTGANSINAIEINDLSDGLYFLRFSNPTTGEFELQKLIVLK